MFTPIVDPLKFKMPTDQEAKEWAEDPFHRNKEGQEAAAAGDAGGDR